MEPLKNFLWGKNYKTKIIIDKADRRYNKVLSLFSHEKFYSQYKSTTYNIIEINSITNNKFHNVTLRLPPNGLLVPLYYLKTEFWIQVIQRYGTCEYKFIFTPMKF